jgi:DNA polymerase-3 subunit delta'
LLDGGRFPHALILQGPPGSGRRTLAAWFAAALFEKAEGPDGGQVNHRKQGSGRIHPDFTVLSGEGAHARFHAETVRRLRMDAHIRPNEAGCRVFVLADADFMTIQAQNALLKLMEEPPDHVFLILACADVQALLPTVRSRATVIPMEVLPPDRCAEGAARLLALCASEGMPRRYRRRSERKLPTPRRFPAEASAGRWLPWRISGLVRTGRF